MKLGSQLLIRTLALRFLHCKGKVYTVQGKKPEATDYQNKGPCEVESRASLILEGGVCSSFVFMIHCGLRVMTLLRFPVEE
jgi:hypothetical protein